MIKRVPQVKSRQSDNMPKVPRTTSIHATAKFLTGMKLITSAEFFWSLYTQTLIRTLNERMEFPRARVPLLRSLGNQSMKQ